MNLSAVIIEDEAPARMTIRSYLERYFKQVVVVAEITSVSEAVSYLQTSNADIIFLDVQLKDGKGIEILEQINSEKFKIIFTTAFDNYTFQAFEHKSFGYLLKPLDPFDFKTIMNRVLKDLSYSDPESKKIKVNTANKTLWIDTKDIIRCESQSNYTILICHPENERFTLAKTLKSVESELIGSDEFIRVHQSHLLNVHFIASIEAGAGNVILKNGEKIPVSRSKRSEVQKELQKFR